MLGSFGCEVVTRAAEQLREIVNLYVVPPENLTSLMEQGMLAEMETEVRVCYVLGGSGVTVVFSLGGCCRCWCTSIGGACCNCPWCFRCMVFLVLLGFIARNASVG